MSMFSDPFQMGQRTAALEATGGYTAGRPAAQPQTQQAPTPGFNPQVAGTYAKALQAQWDQARQANQQQLAQMQGLAANYGQGQLAASHQLTQQQVAGGQQDMANRGLYNSTVAMGNQQSAQNAGQIRDAQIGDTQTQMQLGVLGQNQIQYPNMGAYTQLMSQPGAFSNNSPYGAIIGAMSGLNYGNAAGGGKPAPAGKK